MEELILIIVIILSLFLILGLYKILDKQGLYCAMIILSIISYIFSFKITTILKTNINLGIVTLIATYTCLYITLIKYGRKDIKKIYNMTFYSNIIFGILITIMNYYIPTVTETISSSMKQLFEYNYKILILYPIMLLLGEYLISKIYDYVTIFQKNIFLSIMVSYIISAITYVIFFCILGYINVMSIRDSLYLGITTYIIGIIVTIINIGFTYLLTKKKVKK